MMMLYSHDAPLIDVLCLMMMQRAHVPEFGAWDNGLMYTAMFDEARAAKGGRMMNPNDPAENPDLAALYGEPAGAPRPRGSGDEPRGGSMANVKDHEQGRCMIFTCI